MPVYFSGISLTTAPGANLLAFPMALGERRIAVFILMRGFVEEIFVGAYGETVHDGRDARNSARNRDRLMRLFFGVHPAGQLDDAFVDRTDVNRALAQRRVVSKSLEHSFLELLISV